MTTPYRRSKSSEALNAGPSSQILVQLLEDLNEASATRAAHNESPLQSSASTRFWSSSQHRSSSVWIGGSSLAQDARDGLRATDEARSRKIAAYTIDNSPGLSSPSLCLDASSFRLQNAIISEHAKRHFTEVRQSPDPVGYPHDYMQHTMEGSPLSTTVDLSPVAQLLDDPPPQLQAPPLGDIEHAPLSPLIFSDVCLMESSSSSPQTQGIPSPSEAPASAASIYFAEAPQTPIGDGTRKRTYSFGDPTAEKSPQKRRTITLPNIRSGGYFDVAAPRTFVGIGGDNRRLFRNETFVERAPTPKMMVHMSTGDALPELSSFRPIDAGLQARSGPSSSSQRLVHALTASAEVASPEMPDTPAWMRPMQLIDVGGKSIYMNVHDDGPIRHALCLWCFRAHGDFRKVHKHGYESCGRTEVLDSHYWEDDTWPDDSSDESTSSHC